MTTDTKTEARGYTCHGLTRGDCGRLHRTRDSAEKCISRDHRAVRGGGRYSDRRVAIVGTDGYLYCEEDCAEWIPAAAGRQHGAARFRRGS